MTGEVKVWLALEALDHIADIAVDRDGYSGHAEKLGELVDELHSIAKQTARAIRQDDSRLCKWAIPPDDENHWYRSPIVGDGKTKA
jgi:hypothetical protein